MLLRRNMKVACKAREPTSFKFQVELRGVSRGLRAASFRRLAEEAAAGRSTPTKRQVNTTLTTQNLVAVHDLRMDLRSSMLSQGR